MNTNTTTKQLPNVITNLDIIKTFAVICMVIDHIGFYFFPDAAWFRAVGRLGGAPIWFFLIGYATSRDIPHRWMIGALVLATLDVFLFGHMVPLNVIVTIMAVRVFIDNIMGFVMRTRYLFWLSFILLAMFYIPTNLISEYGTLAILCGIVGYITRHKERLLKYSFLTQRDYIGACVFMVCAATVLQISVFSFTSAQSLFLLIAMGCITYILATLTPTTYPQIKGKTVNAIVQFCGRRTLDIYVGHLIVFKIVFWVFILMGFYQ